MQQQTRQPLSWRPKYTRSKDGCLPCKRRKKRCDMQVPSCSACLKQHLACHWPQKHAEEPELVSLNRTQSLHATLDPQIEQLCSLQQSWDTKLSPSLQICQPVTNTLRSSARSMVLYQHYLERTGRVLSACPAVESVFLNHIIPQAQDDSLTLHAVLAISGAHLLGDTTFEDSYSSIVTVHYNVVLTQLRTAIQAASSEVQWSKLGSALALVSSYEAFRGCMSGTIFMHLKALAQIIRSNKYAYESTNVSWQLALDAYAYLSSVNHIVPYGSMCARKLSSFKDLVADTVSHGEKASIIWGRDFNVYRHIEDVARIAGEVVIGATPKARSEESARTISAVKNLESELIACVGPLCEPEKVGYEIYRCALLLWLKAILLQVCDRHTMSLREEMHKYVELFWTLFEEVKQTRMATIILWPLAIAGSCMADLEDQERLAAALAYTWKNTQVQNLGIVLQLLWDDPSERAFVSKG